MADQLTAPSEASLQPVPVTTTSLWEALDLPPPEAAPSQHESKRVVLLGRPLSGKRTLCRRLCLAAEAQYPSIRSAEDGSGARGGGSLGHGGAAADAVRRPLYRPDANQGDDDIVDDTIAFDDGWDAQRTSAPSFGRPGTGNHYKSLPHGAGIVHDYVVQRIPLRAGEDGGGFSRGGVVKRTVEFFVCDTAGALSSALPTLQSLEEAVVLMVVDVSQPGSIREQLDRSYEILQAHVTTILQTFLPTQDEVRRLKLMEAQQQYWLAEEQRTLPLRAKLAARDGEALVGAPEMVKVDEVNRTVLRVPLANVCPMKSIVVCTKTDVLDKLSRLYDAVIVHASDDELPREVDDIVPPALRAELGRQRAALLPYVAQLIRQYAILRRSALVAVSSRVSTTATDSAGEAALVHPFYRGVWSYVSDRLDGGGVARERADAVETPHLCTANLFPTAFLPSGLDTLALLQPAIASQAATLPPPPARAAADADGPALDGAFTLHGDYLRQVVQQGGLERSVSPAAGRRGTVTSLGATHTDESAAAWAT